MNNTYWLKQTSEEALFPDILWSRPESKSNAGKLAIIGGNGHEFSVVGTAYSEALKATIGVCKVLMPDAVKKAVRYVLPDAEYAPSNPSGAFSKKGLDSFLSFANWGDCCLLAGNFGRNSETAILMESFVQKYNGYLTITHDVVDYFKTTPKLVLNRPHTLIVLSLAQLQKFFINLPLITPITYSMTPLQLVEALHVLTLKFPATICVKHHDQIYVAHSGKIATSAHSDKIWRVTTATKASVFWIQNPSKQFEAVVSSLF